MKLFVKIKHWQFFIVLVLLQFFAKDRLTFIIVSTTYLTLFSVWLYSISIIGQKKLLDFELNNKSLIYLKISCFLIPVLWLIVIINPFVLLKINSNLFSIIGMTVLGLGFFVCWIYAIYYTSKTIKALEIKNTPPLKNYILIMLGFIIWPIGIWFIQPKVNKFFA